jgi:hypothetical protein
MASPQLENGHSRLANELLEALISCPPASVAAFQVWHWVWRHSWGWKGAATTRPTSVRALAEALGISKTKAARALADLLATNHATRNEDGSLSIQKDHEAWKNGAETKRAQPKTRQLFLLSDCPDDRDKVSPLSGQNCPDSRDKTVPMAGTPTIRNIKKERNRKSGARAATTNFSASNDDTPRRRAELGDPERPPEEHPNFGKLGFRRRDELTDQWKENVAKKRCRKSCGRLKASDTWPLCRECTACARCGAKADGVRTFKLIRSEIVCNDCKEPTT